MKDLKLFLVVILTANIGVSCGKSKTEEIQPSPTNQSQASAPASTSPAVPAPTVTVPQVTTPGGQIADVCTRAVTNYTAPFAYTRSGAGQQSRYAPSSSGSIIADQDLRVQIRPNAAPQNTGAGGAQNYTKMAVDVSLYDRGQAVSGATFTIPTQTGQGQYGPHLGVAVGSKSEIVDFSSFIQSRPNGRYSFKVSNVMTNRTCENHCTAQHYCSNWYYDFFRGWQCSVPDYSMIYQCMQLQCDVGPAPSTAAWSLSIWVETDSTPCLTQ